MIYTDLYLLTHRSQGSWGGQLY